MRDGFNRRRWTTAWFLTLAMPSVALAEGSDQLGTSQGLTNSTVIYVDILNASNEAIRWTGSGTATIYSPSNISVGTLASGASYTPTTTGRYRVALSASQSIGNAWDLAVLVSNTPTSGRVHSPGWNLNAGNFTSGINAGVFVIVPGGNGLDTGVVEIKMDGFAGNVFTLNANRTGLVDASGRSLPNSSGPTVEPPLYELYVNPPAISTYTAIVPVITNESFNAGSNGLLCGSIDPAVNKGTFRFTSNVEGGFWLTCDLNNDGLYNPVGSEDTSRSGLATAGLNVVEWDGRRNNGTAVPNGAYNCQLRVTVGDVHFLAYDVETSYEGFRMYAVESTGGGAVTKTPLSMWWNDEFVQATEVLMPNGQRGAVSSGANGIDSGAYTAAASPTYVTATVGGLPTAWSGNARAWGNNGSASKGNNAWLDTYTCLEVSNTFNIAVTIDDGTTDTDADSVSDVAEECITGSEPDMTDTDGDGIPDAVESTPNGGGSPAFIDTDGDGLPDADDVDSNNNGIPDATEGGGDTDGDGVPNFRDGIVVITTPSIVADTTPAITGTTTPLTTIDVYVDSVLWCDNAPVNAAGAFSCVTPASVTLGQGPHDIDVEVADLGAPIYGTKVVTVDTSPPTVTFDIGTWTTDASPTISGTTEMNTALDVFVDGELICVTTSDAQGRFSCGWPPARNDLTFADHTVSAKLTDPAGNAGTGSQDFYVDNDECTSNTDNCDANAACTNTQGSFICTCNNGYSGSGASCTDINECLTANGGCDALTTCTNTAGSRTCSVCPLGFAGTGATGCTDVNECLTANGGCDALTTCTNTAGSRTCSVCPLGFAGTGVTGCTDINECLTANGGCDALSTCTNTAGSRSCSTCPTGFTGMGATSCTDIDECALDSDNCDANATCANTAGGFTCTCEPGFSGSGTVCTAFVIDAPEADAMVDDSTPLVTGKGEPGLEVTVTLDGATGCVTAIGTDGTWSCELPTTTEGEHEVVARTSPGELEATRTFVVDSMTAVSITAPEQDVFLPTEPVDVTGTAEPNSSVTVKLDGDTACTTTADESGNWSCTISDVGDGEHEITATANDGVHEATDSVSVNADRTTFVELDGPKGEIEDATPAVTGTAEASSTVVISIDGEEVGTVTADEAGNFSFEVTETLTRGEHTVSVEADDSYGNQAQTEGTFTVTVGGSEVVDSGASLEGGGCSCSVAENRTSSVPRTLGLLAIGAIALLRRRRRG